MRKATPTPTDEDLSAFGWAPGLYVVTCKCLWAGNNRTGKLGAKRCTRCRECAEAAWREAGGGRRREFTARDERFSLSVSTTWDDGLFARAAFTLNGHSISRAEYDGLRARFQHRADADYVLVSIDRAAAGRLLTARTMETTT